LVVLKFNSLFGRTIYLVVQRDTLGRPDHLALQGYPIVQRRKVDLGLNARRGVIRELSINSSVAGDTFVMDTVVDHAVMGTPFLGCGSGCLYMRHPQALRP
jgi:hypothetical protein